MWNTGEPRREEKTETVVTFSLFRASESESEREEDGGEPMASQGVLPFWFEGVSR